MESSLGRTDSEVARLRDGVVPAAVRRSDALLERLHFELSETASLVERMMLREPLPTVAPSQVEDQLSEGMARIQSLLVDAFRGSETEVSSRLADDVEMLGRHAPVLDLGSGRGELLLVLRERGVSCRGVESDPALAQAARRRGLSVSEEDVLDALARMEEGVVGAVTAYHLLEHLPTGRLLELLGEVHRVLRPGGVFLAECPNPHNLRVGGALFWIDPTHLRPLLPETLKLYLTSTGLSVRSLEYRHPFPDDQRFALTSSETGVSDPFERRLANLERRLDELLNGPRDFVVVAEKPTEPLADQP